MKTETMAKPRTSQRPAIIAILATVVLLTAAGIAHVWVRLRVIHLGYSLSEGSAQVEELVEANRKLRLEIALLKQPGRIEAIAKDKLGMARPEVDRIHVVRVRPHNGARR